MEDSLKETLSAIIEYCEDIESYKNEYGITGYSIDTVRKHKCLITMPLLQIGGEVKNLPDSFKKENDIITWDLIVSNRNSIAHDYKKLTPFVLEKTMNEDIPILMNYCRLVLRNMNEGIEVSNGNSTHGGLKW